MSPYLVIALVAAALPLGALLGLLLRTPARDPRAMDGTAPMSPAEGRAALRAHASDPPPRAALLIATIRPTSAVPDDVDGEFAPDIASFARRLTARFSPELTFRLGQQEFAVLIEPAGTTEAQETAQLILRVAGQSRMSGLVQVGFALATKGRDLWGDAAAAAEEARQRGSGAVVGHDEIRETAVTVTREDLERVGTLLTDRRMAISYQPLVSLDRQRLIGFEALSRPSSRYGFDGPAQAFAAAARLGQAADLDALCREAVLDDGPGFEMPAGTLLFLNISPSALHHPSLQGLTPIRAVERAGLSPERVVFELTSPSTVDPQVVAEGAAALARKGFKISIDDLGAPNAGVEWLGVVHADFLKIDASLLAKAGDEERFRALVRAICVVAEHTGATVIGEGIESREMLSLARSLPGQESRPLQLHGGQGYHLGEPKPQPVDPRRTHPVAAEA
ncbi:EAL domain-containing protein [Egibacter rhizosphaerae]|uniref:EAL domain-containing protein n=1 Tax=Egibacter rhizosphaerae TaxID=1670831 RepID=A0A411YJ80_9ACTN|nr:EAL domain-containing protein [Egibacter rhizosphaerae]QBI21142.1 EAL domain-containing protein [Egibacter rhizosphaerae]